MNHVLAEVERNSNNVVESKVNKGIAGLDTIKKSEKT